MTSPHLRSLTAHRTLARLVSFAPLVLLAVACSAEHAEPRTSQASSKVSAPAMGAAASFTVLAGSTVTNTGATTVLGDLGVAPGLAITGFPPGLVTGGTMHPGDAVAMQAQNDATTAYGVLAGSACDVDLSGQDLGGLTLTPGVYCFSSSAQLTGALVLDAGGDPAAVFVFKVGSTLTTASNASVATINGGQDCGVFWQVGSSATLGTATVFSGTVLALTSITLNTGASVAGRVLARNGAVTMDQNEVLAADCASPGTTTGAGGSDAGSTTTTGAGGSDAGSTATGAGGSEATTTATGAGGAEAGSTAGAGGSEATTTTSGAGGAEAASSSTATGAGGGEAGAGGGEPGAGGAGGGSTTCDGVCVYLDTDPMNCGACGNVCAPTFGCVDAVCVCEVLP